MSVIEYIRKYAIYRLAHCTYKPGGREVSTFLKERLHLMIPAFSESIIHTDFQGRWRYKDDKYGTVIRIYGNVFDKVNEIFFSVLGLPPETCSENTKGFPQVGYYGENHRGYHLQYFQDSKFVEIVCIGKKDKP